MGTDTKIEWCDHTFNPWRGCAKISPGCDHCYAAQMAGRNPAVLGQWGPKGTRPIACEAYWAQPEKWHRQAVKAGRRAKVFVASMADFHEHLPGMPAIQEARERTYGLVSRCTALDWLFLTKRPEHVWHQWPKSWRFNGPPANLWLGISAENASTLHTRSSRLEVISAEVRFISLEPLLAPVDLYWNVEGSEEPTLDWVIVGCESGPRCRPCELHWVETILVECMQFGIPVFVKQLPADRVKCPSPTAGVCRHPEHWPANLRVQEWPRKVASSV